MSPLGRTEKAAGVVALLYGGLCLVLGISILTSLLWTAGNTSFASQAYRLWNDPEFAHALRITTGLYLGAVLLQLTIGLFGTIYVHSAPGLVKALLVAPYAAGVVAPAFSFYVLLSPSLGPFHSGILGLPAGAGFVAILVDSWQWTGVFLLACFVQLERIPRSHFDQARLEGISRWRRWRLIAWPRLRGVFFLYAIIRAIDWARKVDVVKTMFGQSGPGGATETIGLYVTRLYYNSNGDSSYAAIVALLQLLAFGLTITLILRRPAFRRLTREA
jgi:lactose/L-arabinose transport system permease protein